MTQEVNQKLLRFFFRLNRHTIVKYNTYQVWLDLIELLQYSEIAKRAPDRHKG